MAQMIKNFICFALGSLLLLTLGAPSFGGQFPADKSDHKNQITDTTSAINRAVALTGLNAVSKSISASRIALTDTNVPFVKDQYQNRDSWCVTFDDVSLTGKLDNSDPGLRDSYENQRKFLVYIDAKTSQLLQVKCVYAGKFNQIELGADRLRPKTRRKFLLPSTDPKVTFMGAVNKVLDSGMASPFLAKEIDGLYVMAKPEGKNEGPRAYWIIVLKGLPGQLSFGGIGTTPTTGFISCNFMDPTTGNWLGGQSFVEVY